MINYFIVSLPRSGSNYMELTLNNNTKGVSFRGTLLENGEIISKHDFPSVVDTLKNAKIKQSKFLLIVKNPYMWVESICFRDKRDYLDSTYSGVHGELKRGSDNILGERNYNLVDILEIYKDFITEWKSINDVIMLNYETFLDVDTAKQENYKIIEEVADSTVESNYKLPNNPVLNTPDFTQEMFDYYKEQNPSLLTTENIHKINELLGEDFISSLGYKILK